jgi:hypothetical protein
MPAKSAMESILCSPLADLPLQPMCQFSRFCLFLAPQLLPFLRILQLSRDASDAGQEPKNVHSRMISNVI